MEEVDVVRPRRLYVATSPFAVGDLPSQWALDGSPKRGRSGSRTRRRLCTTSTTRPSSSRTSPRGREVRASGMLFEGARRLPVCVDDRPHARGASSSSTATNESMSVSRVVACDRRDACGPARQEMPDRPLPLFEAERRQKTSSHLRPKRATRPSSRAVSGAPPARRSRHASSSAADVGTRPRGPSARSPREGHGSSAPRKNSAFGLARPSDSRACPKPSPCEHT
jgi:hypothetical protein